MASSVPDWSTAQTRAGNAIGLNHSMGVALATGTVSYGYLNITGTPAGLQAPPITPTVNDLPAVSVTIGKESGQNEGPVNTFFARLLGTVAVPVSATAIAAVPFAGDVGPYVLFPIAINQCIFRAPSRYWDPVAGAPKLATSTDPLYSGGPVQTVGQPYVFRIYSTYHEDAGDPCVTGQWTSFEAECNSVTCMRTLITERSPVTLAIGDRTYVQPGVEDTLFESTVQPSINGCSASGSRACENVIVPVVAELTPKKGFREIVGFACVHILLARKGSDKYVELTLINDPAVCTVPDSSGSGPNYGATSPPRLVR